jgi:hypothetical protein
MKLLKLTIHNMASVGDATIDFTQSPLSDSEVFLISGKTGAGKSTILDCICLPLYGTAPRFKNTKINGATLDGTANDAISVNDPRQILRRNTGEGYAELEFTGNNGIHYVARWGAQRSRKKIEGKLQKKNWTLEDIDKNISFTKDADIQQEISDAVGLDFNQFCRTVMLAQGDFTRFLNSNDNDKSEILSKITGTEIYSKIGIKIFERFKEEENIYNTLKLKIEGVSVLEEDEITEKKEALSQLEKENKILQEHLKSESDLLELLKSQSDTTLTIKKLSTKITDLSKDVSSLLISRNELHAEILDIKDDMQSKSEEIKKFDDCKEIFNEAENIMRDSQRIKTLNIDILNEKKSISTRTNDLEEKLLPQSLEYEKEIEKLAGQLLDNDASAAGLKTELDSLGIDELRKEKDQITSRRVELQNLMILLQNYADIAKRIENDRKEITVNENHLKEIIDKRNKLSEPFKIAEEKLRLYRDVYDKLFASSEKILGNIRSSLNIGDVCPLCRQKISASLPAEAEIKEMIKDRKEELDKAKASRDKLNDEIISIEAEIKTIKTAIEKSRKKLEEDNSLTEAFNKVKIKSEALDIDYNNEDIKSLILAEIDTISEKINIVAGKIKTAELLEKDLKILNDKHKELSDLIQKKKENFSEIKIRIETVKTQNADAVLNIAKADNEIRNIREEILSRLVNSRYHELFEKDMTVFCRELKEDVNKYKDLNRQLENLRLIAGNKQNTLESLDNVIEAIRSQLPDFIPESEVSRVSGVKDLHKFATDILMEISATSKGLNDNKERLIEIGSKLEETGKCRQEDDLSFEATTTRVNAINDKIRENDIKKGSIETELKLNDSQVKKLGILIDEHKKQGKILDRWRILYDMFGDSEGKKFRKIAQSYILAELIHSANHYMKSLSDRYRLRVEPGTFVIQVEDAWQGYTVRSAATISGGESFLVSLSLALALSDIGSNFSVDTLFIDEGFGSLSGDVLQNAISTLRLLHSKSGRKVGIISHVEELRERIPVQINVIREGASAESHISLTSR